MATVLNPSFQTMSVIRQSIQNTLKTDIPQDVMPSIIAPMLVTVNQWANQIPAVLGGAGSAASVNLVFAIRTDLFVAPRFTSNVFNVPLADLPAPFQEFIAFIHKLIEAQKTDKEKNAPKVCGSSGFTLHKSQLIKFSRFQSAKRPGRVIKSKPYVDDDDDAVEVISVSEPAPELPLAATDDVVCLPV